MPVRQPARKCLRVGITGGIGSGKTTVCQIFQTLGIPVYDADHWAKWLITHDPGIKSAIVGLLGPDAYLKDGTYNRSFVANAVFSDRLKLDALNQIVHPAVEGHSLDWHLEQARTGCPYTLREAALLIESGGHKNLDALIVVTAPEEVRIERVMQRDGVTDDAVRARIRNQMPESEKTALADYVIRNDGRHQLIPQVLAIHHALVKRSKSEF
ncbi:MAG: dephospho-CoA kinase [Bacteroidetes bacterium]|nr:MAG: dephospho-CoA kinase [Bacteroidota bacterium]